MRQAIDSENTEHFRKPVHAMQRSRKKMSNYSTIRTDARTSDSAMRDQRFSERVRESHETKSSLHDTR